MPTVYTYVETDVDVDIEVDEFVSSCSPREIKELVQALIEDGHIKTSSIVPTPDRMTAQEIEFSEMLSLLSQKYHQMDVTEISMIEELYKKYC
jgi:hypothetical protein